MWGLCKQYMFSTDHWFSFPNPLLDPPWWFWPLSLISACVKSTDLMGHVHKRSLHPWPGIARPNRASHKTDNMSKFSSVELPGELGQNPRRATLHLAATFSISRMFYDLYSQGKASTCECVFIFLKLRPSQMLMLIVVFRGWMSPSVNVICFSGSFSLHWRSAD